MSGSAGSAEGNQAEYQSQGARSFGGGGLGVSTGGKAPIRGGLGMVSAEPAMGRRMGSSGQTGEG